MQYLSSALPILALLSSSLVTALPSESLEHAKATPRCNVFYGNQAEVEGTRQCADYLMSIGGQQCVVDPNQSYPPKFCSRNYDRAQVYGVTTTGGYTSSSCADVARAVYSILDHCTDGSKVHGSETAWGNGDLRVEVHSA